MYLYNIVLALTILSGGTAFPDVGKCTFMEYFCDALKCNTDLVKGLQKDPNGDCSAKFKKMLKCVVKSADICVGHMLSQSQIESIAHKNFNERRTCLLGGSEAPTQTLGSPCTSGFYANVGNCIKTFQQKFAADKSDPDLCSEHAKAKKCLKSLMKSDCSFSSQQWEVINLGLSDYNPYCKDNRDPGATGKGLCYGVKPLNNPLHSNSPAAVGMKISALQALLIPFLLLLFFAYI